MAITYPLTVPATVGRRIAISAESVVGQSESPFTFETQTYVHQGQRWQAEVSYPPMLRADAEDLIGFLLALNGRQGTFLMGDPVNTAPRGTWAGTPLVNGAPSAGALSILLDGFSVGATVKRGDWLQFGSGSGAHLHKVVQDAAADGSGALTLEFWPRLRANLADNTAVDVTSPVGLWRLAGNVMDYSIELAQFYGLSFKAIEAL